MCRHTESPQEWRGRGVTDASSCPVKGRARKGTRAEEGTSEPEGTPTEQTVCIVASACPGEKGSCPWTLCGAAVGEEVGPVKGEQVWVQRQPWTPLRPQERTLLSHPHHPPNSCTSLQTASIQWGVEVNLGGTPASLQSEFNGRGCVRPILWPVYGTLGGPLAGGHGCRPNTENAN